MNNQENVPDYVYVAVIAAAVEKVWEGLTTAEFTRQYWHSTRIRSDFKVGSRVEFLVENDQVGCEGEVLVCNYPHELSYSWRFPRNPDTQAEPPTRVTFTLESIATGTRLTVIHDQFVPGSKMYELVSGGWPLVICGLKTLLETGSAVDFSSM